MIADSNSSEEEKGNNERTILPKMSINCFKLNMSEATMEE